MLLQQQQQQVAVTALAVQHLGCQVEAQMLQLGERISRHLAAVLEAAQVGAQGRA
jgi:hypothetical protein